MTSPQPPPWGSGKSCLVSWGDYHPIFLMLDSSGTCLAKLNERARRGIFVFFVFFLLPAAVLLHTKSYKFFTEITITSRGQLVRSQLGMVNEGGFQTATLKLASHGILTCPQAGNGPNQMEFQSVHSLPELWGWRRIPPAPQCSLGKILAK